MKLKSFFFKYETVFLLPSDAKKTLGKDGWMFNSRKRLGSDVLNFLIRVMGLTLEERYLGMEKYIGNQLQATVIYDDKDKIEHVVFQVSKDMQYKLKVAFSSSKLKDSSELFFPKIQGVTH